MAGLQGILIESPKRPCPRNLGVFFCEECRAKLLSGDAEAEVKARKGCGVSSEDLVCGQTHLGFEWCADCEREASFTPRTHFGEFEAMGLVTY